MADSIIAALGYGSGLDTTLMVKQLAAAAKAPTEARIKARETSNSASVSSLASVSNGIDAFASSLKTLIAGGTLQTQPTASNTDIVSVSALTGARLGDLSAQLEVRQLAKAQTVNSALVAARTASVGKGTLTLAVGGAATDITVDATNNTLSGVAAAINAADKGVSASIVQDGTGFRLVLKGQTGEANGFTLTAVAAAPDTDAGGNPVIPAVALESLTYPPGGGDATTMARVQAAEDAVVKLDGVELRRATNSVADLIPGVRFDLKTAAIGTTVAIGSARPHDTIIEAVQAFASTYNDMKALIDDATRAVGADGTGGGPLRGDVGLRDLRARLSKLTSTPLVAGGGATNTLASIGVATNRDGTLRVDTARLNATIAADPDAVEALFNPAQRSSSPFVAVTSAMGATPPGTYLLTDLAPQNGAIPASGLLNGVPMIATDNSLSAPAASAARGLIVQASAAVSGVTISVDLGLGGALQQVRDALRATTGPLASTSSRLSKEAREIAAARTKMTARDVAYTRRLTTDYAQMEKRVAASKATEAYIKQQVEVWTKSN